MTGYKLFFASDLFLSHGCVFCSEVVQASIRPRDDRKEKRDDANKYAKVVGQILSMMHTIDNLFCISQQLTRHIFV